MKMKFITSAVMATLFYSAVTYAADPYRLHEGDILQVSVWGEDTLQKEVRVLPDGSISFPLAGRVEVANLSTPEVEKQITEKLKTYLPDPQVTVIVGNIDGNRAYIAGKVARPGVIPLIGPITVLQAISMAGGLDKFADEDEIKVIRRNGGKQSIVSVNYDQLIKGQSLDSNVILSAGDTIVVP